MAKDTMTAGLRVRMTSEELAVLRCVADEEASSMGRIIRLAVADYIVRLRGAAAVEDRAATQAVALQNRRRKRT